MGGGGCSWVGRRSKPGTKRVEFSPSSCQLAMGPWRVHCPSLSLSFPVDPHIASCITRVVWTVALRSLSASRCCLV